MWFLCLRERFPRNILGCTKNVARLKLYMKTLWVSIWIQGNYGQVYHIRSCRNQNYSYQRECDIVKLIAPSSIKGTTTSLYYPSITPCDDKPIYTNPPFLRYDIARKQEGECQTFSSQKEEMKMMIHLRRIQSFSSRCHGFSNQSLQGQFLLL